MRLKNRYLLLELDWKDGRVDESMQESAIQIAIRDSIGVNFGDYGIALCGGVLQVKYYNPLTRMCMLRCARLQLQEVSCLILCSVCDVDSDGARRKLVAMDYSLVLQRRILQVLASIACISNIKYRAVLMRMIHNGGTLAACQKAAIAHEKSALQQRRLSHAQIRVATEAGNKLQALGL